MPQIVPDTGMDMYALAPSTEDEESLFQGVKPQACASAGDLWLVDGSCFADDFQGAILLQEYPLSISPPDALHNDFLDATYVFGQEDRDSAAAFAHYSGTLCG